MASSPYSSSPRNRYSSSPTRNYSSPRNRYSSSPTRNSSSPRNRYSSSPRNRSKKKSPWPDTNSNCSSKDRRTFVWRGSRSASSSSALLISADEQTALKIASAISYFIITIWFVHSALEEFLLSTDRFSDHPLEIVLHNRATKAPPPRPKRALLFRPLPIGQGAGNIINGLLSAHMLADEFGRTVCIQPEYESFLRAFRPYQDDDERAWCAKQWLDKKLGKIRYSAEMSLVNFGSPANECRVREKMASEGPILLMANTYPRWAHVSKGYFLAHYEPTPLLRSILPWSEPPNVAVHLRKEDGRQDVRQGLDEETFHALGRALPRDTFLVTNKVEWYDWFAEKYGWRNPGWHEVKHSAIKKSWGARSLNDRSTIENAVKALNITTEVYQDLAMWSDWYTLIAAKEKVWHTHSDFSLSAVHWMNKPSKTIMGMRNATQEDVEDSDGTIIIGEKILDLIDEEWIRDGETPRLIDRQPDNLRNCRNW